MHQEDLEAGNDLHARLVVEIKTYNTMLLYYDVETRYKLWNFFMSGSSEYELVLFKFIHTIRLMAFAQSV
jgi:hypothetical protein